MSEDKEPKIVFAPGAFDQFEGTQEELDALLAEIHSMVESGDFLEQATLVNLADIEEEDPEIYEMLLAQLAMIIDSDEEEASATHIADRRKLH